MKYLIICVLLISFVFAASQENRTISFDTNSTLSAKEISFQKYLEQKEKESQRLEDDGFCSCNN